MVRLGVLSEPRMHYNSVPNTYEDSVSACLHALEYTASGVEQHSKVE